MKQNFERIVKQRRYDDDQLEAVRIRHGKRHKTQRGHKESRELSEMSDNFTWIPEEAVHSLVSDGQ